MEKDNYISPLRILERQKLATKLKVHPSVVREAMELRRNIPAFAEEYILNKESELSDDLKFPLWFEYLTLTSTDGDY